MFNNYNALVFGISAGLVIAAILLGATLLRRQAAQPDSVSQGEAMLEDDDAA